jgi:esterase/lipase superfamily enzyme
MDADALTLDPGDEHAGSLVLLFRFLHGAAAYLLIALAILLVVSAVSPLWQPTFLFRDLFVSRICLVLAVLPVAAALSFYGGSKFDLNFFQVNLPIAKINFSGKAARFVIFSVLLGVPLIVFDPIGVYAASRSKALVPLFFITDRATIPGPSPGSVVFTNDPDSSEALTFGAGTVPIRWSRRDVIRNLRSRVPLSIRASDITLQNLSRDDFRERVSAAVQSSDRRDAFLFVHGFHNPFDSAINAAAKLSYDLKFQGADILYSWPSGDELSSYDHDYENATWSAKHLSAVVIELASLNNLQRLHLIAHSMGTRVLTEAFGDLRTRKAVLPISPNVILAAADIGEPEFSQLSGSLSQSTQRVTLYVSRWDGALRASGELHKGDRVGLRPVSRGGMDVIDTNGLDTSDLDVNHGYLFDSQPVLTDLFELVEADLPPARRSGIRRDEGYCCWNFEHR